MVEFTNDVLKDPIAKFIKQLRIQRRNGQLRTMTNTELKGTCSKPKKYSFPTNVSPLSKETIDYKLQYTTQNTKAEIQKEKKQKKKS